MDLSEAQAVLDARCAPQKVYPVLIARFKPAMVGCFWPFFFFADHTPGGTKSMLRSYRCCLAER